MKILLVCRSFPPEINPRSFRVFELAREILAQGHHLTLVSAQSEASVRKSLDHPNLQVHTVPGFYSEASKAAPASPFKSWLRGTMRKWARAFIPEGKDSKYALILSQVLRDIPGNWDLGISVSVPFASHWGFVQSKINLRCTKTVADCGDPLSANPMEWASPLVALIEAKVLAKYDYISIPIAEAIPSYTRLGLDPQRIAIISQGFKIDGLEFPAYQKHPVPTFMYAGVFYEKIRNPQLFLEWLCQVQMDFKWIIHTDLGHRETMELLRPYTEKLRNRLEVLPLIPRKECLAKMATMDFNLNVSNHNSNQLPSKLIDLSMVQRPFLSLPHLEFTAKHQNLLQEFFAGNYQQSQVLDLEQYKIENICRKFLELAR